MSPASVSRGRESAILEGEPLVLPDKVLFLEKFSFEWLCDATTVSEEQRVVRGRWGHLLLKSFLSLCPLNANVVAGAMRAVERRLLSGIQAFPADVEKARYTIAFIWYVQRNSQIESLFSN